MVSLDEFEGSFQNDKEKISDYKQMLEKDIKFKQSIKNAILANISSFAESYNNRKSIRHT